MVCTRATAPIYHHRSGGLLRRRAYASTILFVLERILRLEPTVPGEWGLMIGLGPGFAAEGALLRW